MLIDPCAEDCFSSSQDLPSLQYVGEDEGVQVTHMGSYNRALV